MAEKLSERLERIARGQVWGAGDHETLDEAIELARRVEWQPLETAPKDGREILLFAQGILVVAHWDEFGRGWVMRERGKPKDQWVFASHWMPLPEPPEGNCNE